jgi:hypothetical protein
MTRAHVRLLGPCFKTGRIGDRLSHRDCARHGGTRRVSAAKDKSHATALDDTGPPRLPFRRRSGVYATEDQPTGRTGHRSRSSGPLSDRSEDDGDALGAYRRQMHRSPPNAPKRRVRRSRRPGYRRRTDECRRVSSALSASF